MIQNEIRNLQEILPKLSPKHLGKSNGFNVYTPNTAAEILHHLQEIYQEAQETQQKMYNEWALKMCREGIQKAWEAEGPIINGEAGRDLIGKVLIKYLAPIDERFLTTEAHRCYQEFSSKYLSEKQLNAVKNDKSWLDEGNIGFVLVAMFNTPKVQLSQF